MGGLFDKPTKSLHSYLTAGDDIETPLSRGTCLHTYIKSTTKSSVTVTDTHISPVGILAQS